MSQRAASTVDLPVLVRVPEGLAARPNVATVTAQDLPSPLPVGNHWAALHTRARSEKVVAQWIAREGATQYVPLGRSRRTYGARVRTSWVPIFPSYVFYDASTYDGYRAFRSNKVAKVLVPKTPLSLGPDLENVARCLAAMPDVREGRPLMEPGMSVEVIKGPLVGAKGRMVRREKGSVLVLMVQYIGFGAEVSIDEAFVRAA